MILHEIILYYMKLNYINYIILLLLNHIILYYMKLNYMK